MKAFHHNFERIPSEHELEFYRTTQPSTSYQRSPETHIDAPSGYNQPAQSPYEPINNPVNRGNPPEWTSSPTIKILGFASHLVLTLMPIAFILLAFLALSVDGDELSNRGRIVYQAAKLCPSIFPIVFAAVVGRLMKTFALWRAERGSTIGLLEQLNGSQNLLAAVERTFLLSGIFGWGFLIILLWALSPLGGQSSLRVLELAQSGDSFTQELYYFNTDNFERSMFGGASSLAYGLAAAQAIYQASLLAPASIIRSSTDLWGNVKIPLMQAQTTYTGQSSQDWIQIDQKQNTTYSGLTGIVTSGLRQDTKSTFTIETSYMNLTCPDPVLFGTEDVNSNSTLILRDFQQWMGNVVLHKNKTSNPFAKVTTSTDSSPWTSFTVDSNYNYTQSANSTNVAVNLIYAARMTSKSFQILAFNCSVGYTHVESSIGCNGTTCRVERMRHSRQNQDVWTKTPLNQAGSFTPFINFLLTFPFMSGTVHAAETVPSDYYVSGNNTPFQPPNSRGANYDNVDRVQFAQRLGALINTAWQAGIAQSSIALQPPDTSVFKAANNYTYPFFANSVTAAMQVNRTVYRANKLWIGLTATISLILFICGVAGMAFRYITTAPDILGYVSTMTRDNPFFNDMRAHGADNLDGLERARLLRDAVVQIQDVKPWQGKSHIALKSVSEGHDPKSSRLRKGLNVPSPLAGPI